MIIKFNKYTDILSEGVDKNLYLTSFMLLEGLIDINKEFDIHDELNDKLWISDRIKASIRQHLLGIAKDFLKDDSGLIEVKDVVLTGSLANYNWSNHSDIDLHIIVAFDEEEAEGPKHKMFKYKQTLWNEHHDIKIEGFEVEIYVQDENEPAYSTGVFSLQDNKWVKHPSKTNKVLDPVGIENKAKKVVHRIESIKKLLKTGRYLDAINDIKSLKEKIRNHRRCGLERGGELSVENIAFKLLRREGYLEELNNLKEKAYDCYYRLSK
jgi:hypothetical protein